MPRLLTGPFGMLALTLGLASFQTGGFRASVALDRGFRLQGLGFRGGGFGV